MAPTQSGTLERIGRIYELRDALSHAQVLHSQAVDAVQVRPLQDHLEKLRQLPTLARV